MGDGAGHRQVPPEHRVLRSGQGPGGVVGSGPGQHLPHVTGGGGIMVAGVAIPAGCGRHRRCAAGRGLAGNQPGRVTDRGRDGSLEHVDVASPSASDPDTADHFRGHRCGPYARSNRGGNRATTVRLCHVRDGLSPFRPIDVTQREQGTPVVPSVRKGASTSGTLACQGIRPMRAAIIVASHPGSDRASVVATRCRRGPGVVPEVMLGPAGDSGTPCRPGGGGDRRRGCAHVAADTTGGRPRQRLTQVLVERRRVRRDRAFTSAVLRGVVARAVSVYRQ